VRDAQGVIDVLNPIIIEGKFTILDKTYTRREEKRFIRHFPKSGIFNVSEEGGVIQGFHVIERKYAPYTSGFNHVGEIGTFVGEAYRRRGVGKRLILESGRFAIGKGYEKLSALIRADNFRSLEFHAALGFEEAGRQKDHFKTREGEYIDEVIMEKSI